MSSLIHAIDDMLSRGRNYFSRDEALGELGLSLEAFLAAANRLIKKQRLASPYRGFYLILRPEDRVAGAPDPECWIDPCTMRSATLMRVFALPGDLRYSYATHARFSMVHSAVKLSNTMTNLLICSHLPEWLRSYTEYRLTH